VCAGYTENKKQVRDYAAMEPIHERVIRLETDVTYIKTDLATVKTSVSEADKNLDKMRIRVLVFIASSLFSALVALFLGYANHLLG
jgi:helix-turn-helix protein